MNNDWMSRSKYCVVKLNEYSKLDSRLTVVSKGRIFTPSFKGWAVVQSNQLLRMHAYDQILCINGVYVNKIYDLTCRDSYAHNVRPALITDNPGYTMRRLIATPDYTSEAYNKQAYLLWQLFYFDTDLVESPNMLFEGYTALEITKRAQSLKTVTLADFVEELSSISGKPMSKYNLCVRDLYSLLCDEEVFNEAECVLNTVLYCMYFREVMSVTDVLYRNCILHNSTVLLQLMLEGACGYGMELDT